jgi:hypothetical protein
MCATIIYDEGVVISMKMELLVFSGLVSVQNCKSKQNRKSFNPIEFGG